ncbi:MAG: CpsB/CapC family capsule biosynthesis tyrosine phosphatase [Bacteroidota bacterium]
MKSIFNIFSSGKDKVPDIVDFSSINADMHSHLIPGIDDGAKTIEDSISLIRHLHAAGYSKLITTPHIMSDYFKNTPEIILEGLETVRAAIKAENIPVTLDAAAEYYIDDGFMHKLEEERLLTFGDNYLLVEISYMNPPDSIKEILFRAIILGYHPVLAHPERYPYWYNSFDEYRGIRDMGVALQLNLNSLSGYYGPDAKRTAEKLIDNSMIDMVGTDMHHQRHAQALQKCMSEKYLQKAFELNLLNRYL